MITRLRLISALCALVLGVIVVAGHAVSADGDDPAVELRSTHAPMTSPRGPFVNTSDPRPFNACEDIPLDVVAGLGLAYTPPKPTDKLRCEYDAGNYQMAVEPIIWRTYEETLPTDALETTINGHRAAAYWVVKPTEWDNRFYFSCMVTFKTSYGVIQQSLYYATFYSDPLVDCPSENMMRANQLSPHYIY
jgi:hypothetical protein